MNYKLGYRLSISSCDPTSQLSSILTDTQDVKNETKTAL